MRGARIITTENQAWVICLGVSKESWGHSLFLSLFTCPAKGILRF